MNVILMRLLTNYYLTAIGLFLFFFQNYVTTLEHWLKLIGTGITRVERTVHIVNVQKVYTSWLILAKSKMQSDYCNLQAMFYGLCFVYGTAVGVTVANLLAVLSTFCDIRLLPMILGLQLFAEGVGTIVTTPICGEYSIKHVNGTVRVGTTVTTPVSGQRIVFTIA